MTASRCAGVHSAISNVAHGLAVSGVEHGGQVATLAWRARSRLLLTAAGNVAGAVRGTICAELASLRRAARASRFLADLTQALFPDDACSSADHRRARDPPCRREGRGAVQPFRSIRKRRGAGLEDAAPNQMDLIFRTAQQS